ncbi:hypothetical protein [Sphingobium nicotianae]|uniref:Phasin family protein n=1 Tax=Sphingobium nicotianae TaxID=2782607 RepID=A0A9X1DDF6_9SPHN|nr:hypothetical protein [Sphingobium nicotianae]MBT2188021.1 hypothetical protein [Sphingobium nicotianae]
MWELMRIGLEMQERMIEVHSKGLDMARGMMNAAETQADVGKAALDMGEALNQAAKVQNDMFDRWINFWGGRL